MDAKLTPSDLNVDISVNENSDNRKDNYHFFALDMKDGQGKINIDSYYPVSHEVISSIFTETILEDLECDSKSNNDKTRDEIGRNLAALKVRAESKKLQTCLFKTDFDISEELLHDKIQTMTIEELTASIVNLDPDSDGEQEEEEEEEEEEEDS